MLLLGAVGALALAASPASPPAALLAPAGLSAVFTGTPPSPSLELKWGLALADSDPLAVGFEHAQSRYQLRVSCGGAEPTVTDGVGARPHHLTDPLALGVTPHASCKFAVRVWDSLDRPSAFSADATFASLPAGFTPAWITQPAAQKDANTTLLRKAFKIAPSDSPPKSAVVSISGL